MRGDVSPTLIREADVSKAVRNRYIARLKRAQRKIGNLSKRSRKGVVRDLEGARRSIIAALADASEFGQWQLPQALAAAEEALREYREAGTATLQTALNDAWKLGAERVSSVAKSAGVNISPAFEFGINRTQLDFAQGWAADLVQAESDDVLKMVSREIKLGFAGGQNKAEIISRVQQAVTKPLRFGSRKKRAETIVRTEVNRIHQASAQASREKMESENVKVTKMWLHSGKRDSRWEHVSMHGQVVGVDEKFRHPGLPKSQWPKYPLDPVLPAEHSVNCGCTVIELFEIVDEADASQPTDQIEDTQKVADEVQKTAGVT